MGVGVLLAQTGAIQINAELPMGTDALEDELAQLELRGGYVEHILHFV